VRATGVKEACYFVHRSIHAVSRDDGLGVLWDRKRDYPKPPPLGKDLTQYWALVASCRALQITLWYDRSDAEAEKDRLDRSGCGGACRGEHEIALMTVDEVEERRAEWWDGPFITEASDA
jgi:hypothetical protein